MTKPTTIRLAPALKKRIERVAKQLDQTPHSLMLEELEAAIAAREEQLEWDLELDRRQAAFDKTRRAIPHADMRKWFEASARGERPAVPAARRVPKAR
jgi:predicted transcriptional regulator